MKNLPAAGKSILVVEDEPTICDICMRVLAGEGYAVDVAADGLVAKGMMAEAKLRARTGYTLILIDTRTR